MSGGGRRRFRYLLNTYVIEKNHTVVEEMIRNNHMHGRINERLSRSKFVFDLYFQYGILHRNPLKEFEKKNNRLPFPETRYVQQSSMEAMERKIEDAEIIVFDAWDVLLYTGVNEYQMRVISECESGSLGSSEYRVKSELDCMKSEILQELYQIVRDYTLDNRFMHEFYNGLLEKKKTLLIYNNSSYDDEIVESVLRYYGYREQVYSGLIGKTERAVHITTDVHSNQDVLYKNVNQLGKRYRTYYTYNVVSNVTDRIINLLLHGNSEEKSSFYEYGVICGGILTCGFCEWLNGLADRKNIDLFLFVARDGEIMEKIYQRYYARYESAYLIFSRFASFELIFSEYPEEYIEKNIKPRMERKNCNNSIEKILRECGLDFMLEYLPYENLKATDILRMDNYERLKEWILKYKEEIGAKFQTSCAAAEAYYRNICRNHRNICVVDLGWHGKSITYLKYFMERKCDMPVQVTGAMIGASCDAVTQNYIRKDIINTYAFEDERWRSQGRNNGEPMDNKEIISIEALYSSTKDTLLRYGTGEDGETVFIYGKRNENVSAVNEIHRGIDDFAEIFAGFQNKNGLQVTPRDAYTPLYYMMQNKKFRNWLYENYREEEGAMNGFV